MLHIISPRGISLRQRNLLFYYAGVFLL
ncbi:hypothetical protein ACTUG7_004559, partial [Escherichia albertii]